MVTENWMQNKMNVAQKFWIKKNKMDRNWVVMKVGTVTKLEQQNLVQKLDPEQDDGWSQQSGTVGTQLARMD